MLYTSFNALVVRMISCFPEHGKKEDQPMFQHSSTVDHIEHVYNSAIDNFKILESCNNLAILRILQYLEAYHRKTKSPIINVGLKALKELQLFKWLNVSQLFK